MSIVTKENNPELYNSLFEDSTIEDAKKVIQNMFNDITPEQFEEYKKELTNNIYCFICKEKINGDSQFIKGKWYHNDCIEQLINENERLKKPDYYEKGLIVSIKEKDKEINRLNNIINGLEEYIKPYLYMLNGIQDRDIYEQCQLDDFTDIMEKLQELKENNKDAC